LQGNFIPIKMPLETESDIIQKYSEYNVAVRNKIEKYLTIAYTKMIGIYCNVKGIVIALRKCLRN
jgi:hypothetical protein